MKTTPLFMRVLTVPRLAFFSLAVGAVLFLLAGVASASQIRAEGNGLIYTANNPSGNWLILTAEYAAPDEIVFVDSEPINFEAGVCYRTQWDGSEVARCAVRNHLMVSTGNGRDRIQVYERTPGWVTVEAGGGNDEISSIALLPSSISPTTLMSGSASRIIFSPPRTSASSSAITTRIMRGLTLPARQANRPTFVGVGRDLRLSRVGCRRI